MSRFELGLQDDVFCHVLANGTLYFNAKHLYVDELGMPIEDYEFCCGDIPLKNPGDLSLEEAFNIHAYVRTRRFFGELDESGLYFVVLEGNTYRWEKDQALRDVQIPPHYRFFMSGNEFGTLNVKAEVAFMRKDIYIQKTSNFIQARISRHP